MTVQSPDFDMCMILSILACGIMYRNITQARDQFWLLLFIALCVSFFVNDVMEVPSSLTIPAVSVFVAAILLSAYVYEWLVAQMHPSTTLRTVYVIDVGLVNGVLMWLIIR
ncbi:hypothetical protein pEaSNUABM5_00201 [Erwinia phage pEa_SNUABM_5]|uniref:Uncharacterized protein n=1 Tax=Erwinia phage pEa_SNUABM_5 TaxID=2797313 RepID=A0A7T8EPK5_9CAUD|nr:hypothetical protein MPK73_gp201 [Erwinia phage pEa_SNUABM_5]QQO90343.1 hypothetical protein pEaSNUABM5_00201 [Erwinia phage pEa_SNUABM_5]